MVFVIKIIKDNFIFTIPLASLYFFNKYRDNLYYDSEPFKDCMIKLEKYNKDDYVIKNKLYNYYNTHVFSKFEQDNHFKSLIKFTLYNNYDNNKNINYQYLLPLIVKL